MGSRMPGSRAPGELQLALCSFGVMSGGAVPEALPRGPWRLWEAGSRGSEAARPLQVLRRQALLSSRVGWVFSLPASGPGCPELWLRNGGLGRDWSGLGIRQHVGVGVTAPLPPPASFLPPCQLHTVLHFIPKRCLVWSFPAQNFQELLL